MRLIPKLVPRTLVCLWLLGCSALTVQSQLIVRDGADFDGAALSSLSAASSLAVSIETINLLPDTADQIVELSVTGGLDIAGINLYGLVADGFPDISGSSQDGPNITDVDLIGDATNPTIFFASNSGQNGADESRPQAFFRSLTVGTDGDGASVPVTGSGVFARLTVDTTGISSGSFALILGGKTDIDPNYPSLQFLDVDAQTITTEITDGTLTIVPEPQHVAWATGGLLGLVALLRRRARSVEPPC